MVGGAADSLRAAPAKGKGRTMHRLISMVALVFSLLLPVFAADISGKWTATFETPIGTQNYTYEFKLDGEKLTGTAKSQTATTAITEGMVKGDEVTFVENLKFEGQDLRIAYKGKISGDEIKFTRQVAEFGAEELVAKRVK